MVTSPDLQINIFWSIVVPRGLRLLHALTVPFGSSGEVQLDRPLVLDALVPCRSEDPLVLDPLDPRRSGDSLLPVPLDPLVPT